MDRVPHDRTRELTSTTMTCSAWLRAGTWAFPGHSSSRWAATTRRSLSGGRRHGVRLPGLHDGRSSGPGLGMHCAGTRGRARRLARPSRSAQAPTGQDLPADRSSRLPQTASGRSFTVPQYVVTVQPGDADDQMATAEQVLANGIHDLMVWIAEPSVSEAMQEPGREMIRRLLGGDPRVRFGPSTVPPPRSRPRPSTYRFPPGPLSGPPRCPAAPGTRIGSQGQHQFAQTTRQPRSSGPEP